MKSCIQWRKNFKYLPQIDEFNINFKEKKQELLNFLQLYGISQRVNIKIDPDISDTGIDLLVAIGKEKKYHIAICFNWNNPNEFENITSKFKDNEIPFYFSYLIDNWDELHQFLNFGVSDIFISGQLGFDLIRVKQIVPENIQIRCFGNICQARGQIGDGLKTFFIRPEDVKFYEEYIDVLQFYNAILIQNTLYKVYFIDKQWNGDLQFLISGLKANLNGFNILTGDFAKARIGCQKECIKGGRCKICDKVLNISRLLDESTEWEVYNKRKGDN